MSDTTVAIFGTAQEISWGDVPVDMMTHYAAPVSKLAYRKEATDLLNSLT